MKHTWEPGAQARHDEDWFKNRPPEEQWRFKEQDRVRIAAHIAVQAGTMTREAFVTLCMNQIRENMHNAPLLLRGFPDAVRDDRSIAERAGLMNPPGPDDRVTEDFDDGFTESEFEDGFVDAE